MTLTNLRLEIEKHFPGKYTDAELKKITGKNREKVIDQYFNAELPQEEEEDEEDAQDLYANNYNPADNAFAYVNPMLYSSNFSSDVPSTSHRKNAFPSDTTPQQPQPKHYSLRTPFYEDDFNNDEDNSEEDDDESRSVKKAINSVKSKITDLKAFSAPKGKSSQIPLSSDIASFGTQGAFSEPNFNDESDYVKSFISVLEDDAEQLNQIKENKRKSKIPKAKKAPAVKIDNTFTDLYQNDDDI